MKLMKKLNSKMRLRGETNFVAIIVLIVIIIALGVVFRTQIEAAVKAVFKNLTDFINKK